jgi:hypothetical protein
VVIVSTNGTNDRGFETRHESNRRRNLIPYSVFSKTFRLFWGSVKAWPKINGAKYCCPGLPDGVFLYQKWRFGHIFEDLGMENVCVFHDQLVCLV